MDMLHKVDQENSLRYDNMSSPLIGKGVSATLTSGRCTLSYSRGRYYIIVYDIIVIIITQQLLKSA